ncbi:MAG TPA: hypothetical protein PLP17_05190, partial [Oligoflexia bacterium]|nr:hypothetical protein [Oligoflexia bacterium]
MLSLAEKIAGKDCAGFARRIGEIAGAQGVNAYLVGGFVRDVLLGICSPDIDFMLEGDALLFVEQLSRSWSDYFPSLAAPARIAKFSRYKTAKIWFAGQVLPGVDRLDFSSARTEHYPVPGGRPVVASGDLYADLARRDFSVNAMAINITSGDDGMLCDFFGGQDDLALKLLRVLHARSFIDDPVRAIRAARLMSRLGFTLEPETA